MVDAALEAPEEDKTDEFWDGGDSIGRADFIVGGLEGR
jgi:hypothetical protein